MDERDARPVPGDVARRLTTYPLFDALLHRRSRRFAKGMHLHGGPLAYESAERPERLSLEEEAALAFAACGITGYALAELPYQTGGLRNASSGNIMTHFVGRTAASGDAMHNYAVFVLNDEGAWYLKRPQDHPRSDLAGLIEAARDRRLLELYERCRVRIADGRVDTPREWPFVPPFNKYSANVPGTTYFLPVAELTALYINVLLTAFDDELAMFVLDDRDGHRPAGIARFARSAGGHLEDDPRSGRVATLSFLETWICEFCAIEQGGILQNLGLMAEAIGVGGFPHFAAHPFGWPLALGFRIEDVPFSRLSGLEPGSSDFTVPTPVGLEREGRVLLKPYCPPYYASMREAVLAFVDYKFAEGRGTFRDGGAATAWKDGALVQAGIPRYSEHAVEATIAYCEHVYRRYGRFPASSGPFRTVLAYQAHRLDPAFYERFYRREAVGR